MCVGFYMTERKTKMIKEFGGLAHNMPVFAVVYCVILMASVGLPLTVGFIGSFIFFRILQILSFLTFVEH